MAPKKSQMTLLGVTITRNRIVKHTKRQEGREQGNREMEMVRYILPNGLVAMDDAWI